MSVIHVSQSSQLFRLFFLCYSKYLVCKFGDKCNYKHPKCKFGLFCTKEDCTFSHPSERQWKYYLMCTKPRCLYLHPVSNRVVKIHTVQEKLNHIIVKTLL